MTNLQSDISPSTQPVIEINNLKKAFEGVRVLNVTIGHIVLF